MGGCRNTNTALHIVLRCLLPCALSVCPEVRAQVGIPESDGVASEPADGATEPEPTSPEPPPLGPEASAGEANAGDEVPAPTSSAQAQGETVATEPPGAPPELAAADPRWHETDPEPTSHGEPTTPSPTSNVDVGLGAKLFLIQGKLMPSLDLRFGETIYWGKFEFSPVWLTRTAREFEGRFVGNHWGLHFLLAPFRRQYVDLFAGVGLDIYHLWGIHGDEASFALTLQAEAVVRLTPSLGLSATLRGYPWHSKGLELGVDRQGERTLPLLGSVGAEWRFE